MEKIKRNNLMIMILSVVFVAVALLMGVYSSRLVTKPLILLADDVDKIGKFQLDSQVEINTHMLEVIKIHDSIENMKKGLRSFKKYVPSDLVIQLMKLGKEAVIEGENRVITLFFSDIAGFTSISEQLSPEQLVDNLGVYFDGLSRIILNNNGTVDKYIGDAIMAFWGAPNLCDKHPTHACLAALQCARFLDELSVTWQRENRPLFNTRIGIHTGEAIVGNMGYDERMNYTVIGDSVNVASRLEGLNKYYGTGIIISEDTYSAVKDHFEVRKLDMVAVKGRAQGILIYELVAEKDSLAVEKKSFIDIFNTGLDAYFSRNWQDAISSFTETSRLSNFTDIPSKLMLERCHEYVKNPPADDWTGIFVFDKK